MLILVLSLKCDVSCSFLFPLLITIAPKPIRCHKTTEILFQEFPSAAHHIQVYSLDVSQPWQGKASFLGHTCPSCLLGSSLMQESRKAGWEEDGELWGCGVYSFKTQNEKGNLSCKMSLVTVVMPNIKVRCPSWIGMLFQMSLFIHISGVFMMKL